MKKNSFVKMNGAGNDFIIIEAAPRSPYRQIAKKICDRTEGIGADGLIVLDRSQKVDYRMRIFNPDGSEAEMCGNGVRCLASYILKTKKPPERPFSIETLAGTILATTNKQQIAVRLTDPKDYTDQIELNIASRKIHVSYIDTGVPHVICFVHGLDHLDINALGKEIRYHKKFLPRGTNVNFVEQMNTRLAAVRTYERGVEAETKACGTGSVASGIIAFLKLYPNITQTDRASMMVKTQSGEKLKITFSINKNKITNVWLQGSATLIAEGTFYY
jgi:diaminopimelate epimerase